MVVTVVSVCVFVHEFLQEAACGYALLIMATYWVTEALPLAITALLPVVLFPILGVLDGDKVAAAYLAVCTDKTPSKFKRFYTKASFDRYFSLLFLRMS